MKSIKSVNNNNTKVDELNLPSFNKSLLLLVSVDMVVDDFQSTPCLLPDASRLSCIASGNRQKVLS